ncbi:hypothetical protein CspeluHIS016_0802460 [Cutaneotrichosporon spelunceum]|uniref:PNK3P-domain-containing protein n=1 Tax=Cutaneotrichosporon spelunceum TaxID=1672016 RepID=A0AAD3TZB1_9TREE|nr:hypothetical protein CspeluHIS016_0802460 [Cutaneotrichosporon spelunceum]
MANPSTFLVDHHHVLERVTNLFTMPGLPAAGVFCRDGPPSLLHFYNRDVFAEADAAASLPSPPPEPEPSSPSSPSSPTPPQRRNRIALSLYDLDGTLIRPKSGYKFPRGADDWMWWHRDVPKRLRADVAAGRHVIVLSNQNLHGRLLRDWKDKIRMIAHEIDDVPIRVFAALDRDKYRKPNIGMLEYVLRMYAERGWDVDLRKTFFVGDAAGRTGDHSSDDRNMAHNANLTFRTPEYHFNQPFPRAKTPDEIALAW